ncbi:hypothetical protein GHT06_010762 [Daphnia sinensis]|uniref:Uncharacterized protein n=1 Tax=Daphnia sinensis TaxID=1820382 RepID=A0AAD5L135_9CRUS|nr:hypothetical protein GHT06_010762 [Daphnia sinensis]
MLNAVEMKVLVEPNKYYNQNLLNILVDEFDSSSGESKSGQQTQATNSEKVFSRFLFQNVDCAMPSMVSRIHNVDIQFENLGLSDGQS